ncbi:substrate-binding domain-containing protein [Corynebacterium poyangense]|uniref:Substrate-binding domain-containing protein n=1 Tax=Corynebacterium poyangense TaxID=2684405 RepID=A0A7H0SR26_9CORY|nr:LacI family DNA-binding transcriptional regulator [Corynebacterium poyangense]QNQ91001.1 substrate-binding domain-containing protein [Corynebacterium poyangense]
MVKRSSHRGTLASVAAELGVSRTTVSNAYNRPEQLSSALREKILAAAERMGYPGPDPTARSLRAGKVGALGVLLTEHLSFAFEDKASVDFLAGVAEASYGSDTALTLVPVGPSTSDDHAAALKLVNSAVVDGFVIYSVAANDPYLRAALARHVPVVLCDQPTDHPELPFVGIDDFAAIQPAAQALVDAGHRRVGILSPRLFINSRNGALSVSDIHTAELHLQRSRVLGALAVFGDAGIDPETVPVVSRHINDRANTRDAAREILETYPDLTAILCTTDSMALAVLDYAYERGISVPEELSVTGFDGIEPAVDRNLCTIAQPNKHKGAAAGRMLLDLIEDRQGGRRRAAHPPRRILATRLIPGATVAPPRP